MIAALLLFAAAAKADCLDTATTNFEFAACSASKVRAADARMAAAWRRLFTDEGGTKTPAGRALLDEQRAWIAFRVKACREFQLPDAGRESQVLHGPLCEAGILEARARDLEGRYLLNHQDQIKP